MLNVHDEQRLREFLKDRFHSYSDALATSAPLNDIVDSLGLFELVEFVERTWAIRVPTADFSPQRFSSIHNILELVAELQPA